MPDNYLSGKDGYVKVGTSAYSFAKWDSDIATKAVPINNFTSGGFDDSVAGFTGAKITLQGPYNQGNMPLVSGNVYTFHLGFGLGMELVISARVTNIKPANDAEGNPVINVTCVSKGTFTPAIV